MMIDEKNERYGSSYSNHKGYIAHLDPNEIDGFNHRFGGDSWSFVEVSSTLEPTLLIVLDLKDPKLNELMIDGCDEIPLCSHINTNNWNDRQMFQFDPSAKTISSLGKTNEFYEVLDEADMFPNPLIQKKITLHQMDDSDIPSDENSYWRICEGFVGGSSFIRILGPVVWLQNVEREFCSCGKMMIYVCSIGYESYDHPQGYVEDSPFFIGEAALYFFICKDCISVNVISQST